MATSYPSFPELSRAPQIDEEEDFDDPTIRDQMENGVVRTAPRYLRLRETFKINFRYCSAEDKRVLKDFIKDVGGWAPFHWTDNRDPHNPDDYIVRFSKLPTIKDDDYVDGGKSYKFSFEVTEL